METRYIEVLKELLSHNADVNLQDKVRVKA